MFQTLSYFDGVNLAKRNTSPTLMTASLMDPICPPSTVFGAFHNLVGPHDLKLWRYNAHEGGGPADEELALEFFAERLRG